VDGAGNLIIKKPASPGREHAPAWCCRPTWIWSARRTPAPPTTSAATPIVPRLADGWLVADDTTLGADNGIGVALILAALEDATLVHGPSKRCSPSTKKPAWAAPTALPPTCCRAA
jgi:dipeptidase D